MPSDLANVETIAIVLLENRSFDHMLGYLSLPPHNRSSVEGLRADQQWLSQQANMFAGRSYLPFYLQDRRLPADPPHDRAAIALQLGTAAGGSIPMKGFVASYAHVHDVSKEQNAAVMGYYTDVDLPITHFFAESYAICDHWFAPLPAGTHPNRLMAMAGFSKVENNLHLIPEQELVYDWLKQKGVRWRVYHDGIPFMAMMPRWVGPILFENTFREFDRLVVDIQEEKDDDFPQLIFIEPTYTDAPHEGDASDDHPPSSIVGGQEFLRRVYLALTSNPDRWKKTVLIVTYDEHGGFFDHLPPLPITTMPPSDMSYLPFTTTGVRVPAMVVSPLVEPRTVCNDPFDHTSILRFLGEKFNGGHYSPYVDSRPTVGSVAKVLNRSVPRVDIPTAPRVGGYDPVMSINTFAFQQAADGLIKQDAAKAGEKFPELWHYDSPFDTP